MIKTKQIKSLQQKLDTIQKKLDLIFEEISNVCDEEEKEIKKLRKNLDDDDSDDITDFLILDDALEQINKAQNNVIDAIYALNHILGE